MSELDVTEETTAADFPPPSPRPDTPEPVGEPAEPQEPVEAGRGEAAADSGPVEPESVEDAAEPEQLAADAGADDVEVDVSGPESARVPEDGFPAEPGLDAEADDVLPEEPVGEPAEPQEPVEAGRGEAAADSGPVEPESVEDAAEPEQLAADAGADDVEVDEVEVDEVDADDSGPESVPVPADAFSAEPRSDAAARAPRPEGPGEPEAATLGDLVGRVRDMVSRWKKPADQAADRYATVDRPAFNDWAVPEENTVLFRYDSPLDGPDGKRIPLFDGPPTREQTAQGSLGDCGIISTMGAVAEHRPEAISERIRENDDGTYEVTLHQTKRTFDGDWAHFEPTGKLAVLTVTPDLPVSYALPEQPAYAKAEGGVAWGPVLEKAIAGVDQTWDEGRLKRAEGYERLNLGSVASDRAELLTQLTGEPAYTENFPTQYDMQGYSPNRQLLDTLREKLAEGSPVLVETVHIKPDQPRLPNKLIAGHAYEVTEVDGSGLIHLRNPYNAFPPAPLEIEDFRAHVKNHYTTLE